MKPLTAARIMARQAMRVMAADPTLAPVFRDGLVTFERAPVHLELAADGTVQRRVARIVGFTHDPLARAMINDGILAA